MSQPSSSEERKIDKAARDFEAILASQWLEKAHESLASAPGGNEEDNDDPSAMQFQGVALQAVAGAVVAHGGFGIARLLREHLGRPHEGPAGSGRGSNSGTYVPGT